MELDIHKTVYGAFFIILGILFSQMFHIFGGPITGQMILPMHFPVFISGIVFGPFLGVIVGILTPLISALFTGMPPLAPPIAVLMMFELGFYGLLSGWFYKRLNYNVFISIFFSMFVGRIGLGLVLYSIMPLIGFKVNVIKMISGSVITGLPGIVLQLILIPVIIKKTDLEEKIYANKFNKHKQKVFQNK